MLCHVVHFPANPCCGNRCMVVVVIVHLAPAKGNMVQCCICEFAMEALAPSSTGEA